MKNRLGRTIMEATDYMYFFLIVAEVILLKKFLFGVKLYSINQSVITH